jgi:hypothetical protein
MAAPGIAVPRRLAGEMLGLGRLAVARAGAKVKAWRLHAAVPGLAGMGLISAGVGMRFGAWAGLLAAGIFLLRVDNRL